MDAFALRWAIEKLLLPPGGPLLLALVGLLLVAWRGRSRLGYGLLTIGLVVSLLFSLPAFAGLLCAWVEGDPLQALPEVALGRLAHGPQAAGAVVILGGGVRSNPREGPDRAYPNRRTAERLMQGAWVARASGLPILVSGGAGSVHSEPEALVMARALERWTGLKARWREVQSSDTAGNARESAAILRQAGISRIVLVTQAYHMPRAQAAFEAAGLAVVPAPHGFLSGGSPGPGDFIPTASATENAWLALHEALGLLWYRWRGYV